MHPSYRDSISVITDINLLNHMAYEDVAESTSRRIIEQNDFTMQANQHTFQKENHLLDCYTS